MGFFLSVVLNRSHHGSTTMAQFADRLTQALQLKGNAVCVGLDPRWESLPMEIRKCHRASSLSSVAAAYEEFCNRVLDIVAPVVPVVKPQSAFFEACGPDGMAVLQRVLGRAKHLGVITIMDGKRNDIASTAEAYAEAAFSGVHFDDHVHAIWDADSATINPYLGRDAVEPFLRSARRAERGVFVLVRTSNPGAGQFQDLNHDGSPLFFQVGKAVESWSRENLAACGFGDVGAVVGAMHTAELAKLRELLPHVFFLLPGFGAQGAKASDTAGAFRADGLGAIVSSSRGILFPDAPEEMHWEAAILRAVNEMIADLNKATPMCCLRKCV